MSKPIFLTEEGLAALEQELEDLKSVKRKEIAEKIKVALSFGDLSENSEYDEAKNDQAIVEARIADIEVMLKNVQVIDESELGTENIHIGSKVEVKVTAVKNGESSIKEYRIVGSNEANPKAGRISDESLIGKSLLSVLKILRSLRNPSAVLYSSLRSACSLSVVENVISTHDSLSVVCILGKSSASLNFILS